MFVGRNEEERALASEEKAFTPMPLYPGTPSRLFAGMGPYDQSGSIWKKVKKFGGKAAGKVWSGVKTGLKMAALPAFAAGSLVARIPGVKGIPGIGKALGSLQKMSDAQITSVAKSLSRAVTAPIRLAMRKSRSATISAVAKKNKHRKPTKTDVKEANKIIIQKLQTWQGKPADQKLLRFAGKTLAFTGISGTGNDVRAWRSGEWSSVGSPAVVALVAASAALVIALTPHLVRVFTKTAAGTPPSEEEMPTESTEETPMEEGAPSYEEEGPSYSEEKPYYDEESMGLFSVLDR